MHQLMSVSTPKTGFNCSIIVRHGHRPNVGASRPRSVLHRFKPALSYGEKPIAIAFEELRHKCIAAARCIGRVEFEHDMRPKSRHGLLGPLQDRPFETLDIDLK